VVGVWVACYEEFLLLYFFCCRGLVFHFREMIFVQLLCDNFLITLCLILTLGSYYHSSFFSFRCFWPMKREKNEVVTKVVSNGYSNISVILFPCHVVGVSRQLVVLFFLRFYPSLVRLWVKVFRCWQFSLYSLEEWYLDNQL
jgi:hypothetical protein